MSNTNVSLENLQSFIKRSFIAVGFTELHADKCASLMAKADLMGQEGHGAFRLPQYIKRINSGGLNTNPDIKTIEDRTAMALLDGDNGMGHLVMSHATEFAMSKAATTGIAWVGARHSNHAGPKHTLWAILETVSKPNCAETF